MKKLALVIAALSALALGACKKEEAKPVETKTAPETTTKPAEPAKPAEAPAANPEADKTGVEECDKFIASFRACIAKMPEEARGPSNETLKTMVEEFKQAAGQGDEAKESLKVGCKSASDGSKQAYATHCPDVKWD